MRRNWQRVPIREVAEIFDGPHATPSKTIDGPVFLGISSLKKGRLDLTNTEHLSETDYVRWTRRVEPRVGDVVFSYETRLGEAAMIPPGLRCCLGRRMGLLRARSGKIDERFLLYAYLGPDFQETLRSRTIHGSTVDRIPLIDMPSFPIDLPADIDDQRAIAAVLGALDDKIEQNRRTARALERLARAIFRAWFVDFEPVKAKAAGAASFPSMPQPVFDALPARFVDSEIGPVPERWEVGTLGDHCKINERSVRRGEITGEIEYVDIASVTMGRLDGVQRVPFNEAPSRARRRVAHGDTIWSCVRPNRRSYLFIHTPATNRIVSTGFAVLSPSNFGPSFLYMLVTQSAFVDYLVANADGSAYPAVRPEHFASARVLVPPAEAIQAFEMLTMSGRDFIASADRESRQLAKIRDFLLPKLLSDAVRVKEAERLPETTL